MTLRLWLVIALLCGVSDSAMRVGLRCVVPSEQGCLQQEKAAKAGSIESNDGVHRFETEEQQWPMASSIVRVPHPPSVSSSRPTRVSPSDGGKWGRVLSRWLGNDSFHLSVFSCWLHRGTRLVLRAAAMSPRHYYVIALRHILC